ncbi:MAG: hypothetical protein Tsb005_05580 [Gammaproteobacteria bacterium]
MTPQELMKLIDQARHKLVPEVQQKLEKIYDKAYELVYGENPGQLELRQQIANDLHDVMPKMPLATINDKYGDEKNDGSQPEYAMHAKANYDPHAVSPGVVPLLTPNNVEFKSTEQPLLGQTPAPVNVPPDLAQQGINNYNQLTYSTYAQAAQKHGYNITPAYDAAGNNIQNPIQAQLTQEGLYDAAGNPLHDINITQLNNQALTPQMWAELKVDVLGSFRDIAELFRAQNPQSVLSDVMQGPLMADEARLLEAGPQKDPLHAPSLGPQRPQPQASTEQDDPDNEENRHSSPLKMQNRPVDPL